MPWRSAREWITRGLLASAALAGGYAGAAQSLGFLLRNGDGATAHALAPYDGRVTAALARKLAGPEASDADRARADMLARIAIRQDPTAIAAVSTLGLNAQLRGDVAGARRLFAYAQALSRRHLETQVWAIEDAVGRGDIPGALRHYDIALRTNPNARDLLFPVLVGATADPTIRSALVVTLAGKPVWGEAFINRVAAPGTEARVAADLFFALEKAGVSIPEGARAAAIGGLITAGSPEAAWSYYAAIRRGADRRRSRDVGFTADLATPSPFDWTPIAEGGSVTTIQTGSVDFTAPASAGGPLLQQMQMLPPGDYRIEGHSTGIDQPDGAGPYWALTCRAGRELGRVDLPNSAQAGGVFAGSFSVPANCPVQMLTLVARASDTIGGLSGQIDRLQLAPVR